MFSAITKLIGGRKTKKPCEEKKITLGICAMDKKAKSKPMREILNRLSPDIFDIVIFGDDKIFSQPIELWPQVECLITFYSTNFPIEKALDYIKLRKPFLINDLEMHNVLSNRRKIYDLLEHIGINVPKHIFVERPEKPADPNEPYVDPNEITEFDDYIMINGVRMDKPFVEKPYDAEDHNVYIYYPMSCGGGSKRLFRKVNDRSSEFYPKVNEIRRDGCYIYEEFLITQGTDVKVYALGPNYGHAEARKSPVVDGKVNRGETGLEIRYPVILTLAEKEMSRKITEAFKQTVCGFDILRVSGKSYVCDVNGWSFVKNSRKYYDDASQVLAEYIISNLRPTYNGAMVVLPVVPTARERRDSNSERDATKSRIVQRAVGTGRSSPFLSSDQFQSDKLPSVILSSNAPPSRDSSVTPSVGDYSAEELVTVIAVMRHGDRTPKQKTKVISSHEKFLEFFKQHSKSATKELKVKTRANLLQFLGITIDILGERKWDPRSEYYRVLRQIRDVLERHEISGINRKLQMKPMKWDTKVENGETVKYATELLLIMKWGGDLTLLGRAQAENLGTEFRQYMYPDAAGGGVLRLHSTYRHDLKIKSSDEGRVMKTAAAFAKGLLELEGQLTPIMSSLVQVEENVCVMLDKRGNEQVKADMDRYQHHMDLLQTMDREIDDEMVNNVAPECSSAVRKAMFNLHNPRRALKRMYALMESICLQLNMMCEQYEIDDLGLPLDVGAKDLETNQVESELNESSSGTLQCESSEALESETLKELYMSESFLMCRDRWEKIYYEFYDAEFDQYDLTKIPDIFDMVKYDCIHNDNAHLHGLYELYKITKEFENCVVPQEFGIYRKDKRALGGSVVHALVEKMKTDLESNSRSDMSYMLDHSHADDLGINSLGRSVKTRLYFTSESHLHSLLNVLRYPEDKGEDMCAFSPVGLDILDNTPELSYLTQIVIRLFATKEDPPQLRCEICFSPGACFDPSTPEAKTAALSPYVVLNKSISYEKLCICLENAINVSRNQPQEVVSSEKIDEVISDSQVNLEIQTVDGRPPLSPERSLSNPENSKLNPLLPRVRSKSDLSLGRNGRVATIPDLSIVDIGNNNWELEEHPHKASLSPLVQTLHHENFIRTHDKSSPLHAKARASSGHVELTFEQRTSFGSKARGPKRIVSDHDE